MNDIMEPHRARLAAMNDEELLTSLTDFTPLPDESDPAWFEEDSPLRDRDLGLRCDLSVSEGRLEP